MAVFDVPGDAPDMIVLNGSESPSPPQPGPRRSIIVSNPSCRSAQMSCMPEPGKVAIGHAEHSCRGEPEFEQIKRQGDGEEKNRHPRRTAQECAGETTYDPRGTFTPSEQPVSSAPAGDRSGPFPADAYAQYAEVFRLVPAPADRFPAQSILRALPVDEGCRTRG